MTSHASDIRLLRELELSEHRRLSLQRRNVMESLEPEDTHLWTLLDLMSLMMIFFIILYAAPAPPPVPPSVTAAVETLTVPVVVHPIPRPVFVDTEPEFHEEDLERMESHLHQAMTGTALTDYTIRKAPDRIHLVIGENISFPVAKADLLDHIRPPLSRIAETLSREPGYRIVVAGHTDDTPIHTLQFPSNWELSLARALSVARFLMDCRVDPARISVEGFGPYRPVADNADPDSRRANRRVEISLIPKDL